MAKKILSFIAVILFVLSLSTMVMAQQGKGWRGSGGWGQGSSYNQLYDPSKVESLAGQVVKIEQSIPMKRMSQGVVLLVKSAKEIIAVHLGPSWYIERLDTKIVVGDKLGIKGVRTTFAGQPAILASEVTKGEDVLTLRDANGVPVWAGWGRRR